MRRLHIIAQATPGDGYLHGTVALWLDTPLTLVVANPTRTSQVPWATPAEVSAIQNGTVTEQTATAKVPLTLPGTTTPLTVAQLTGVIMQDGQASLPQAQADLDASAPPAQYVGGTYDDVTGWAGLPS